MTRHDGRRADELRTLEALPDFLEQPHGCVLWSQGKTRVLCTATVEEEIPRWLRGKGRGWMTAEYSLLPASTGERTQRGVSRGRPDGRTVEIQRLIGRALRAVCDFEALGERTLVARLRRAAGRRWHALRRDHGRLRRRVSCARPHGALQGAARRGWRPSPSASSTARLLLDLDYPEDSQADTDMNVVMTADGRLVEVQATAERHPFSRDELDALLDLAATRHRRARGRAAGGRHRAARVKARLASGNPHKLVELRRALPAWELRLLDGDAFPAETGSTYAENARIKARFARSMAPPDEWVIGDDSGIEASGLGGRPGIASARWADDGVARLLEGARRRRGPGGAVRLRRSWRSRRTVSRSLWRGRSRVLSAARPGVPKASVTTRSSSRAGSR